MIQNGYSSLEDFKTYGISNSVIDEADDTMLSQIIGSASRYIDNQTGRTFYPRIETRYYNSVYGRKLWFDDDLLEILDLTNGEGTAIVAASYNLIPLNEFPKYAINLIPSSNIYWQRDANSNQEGVIDVEAIWGYHERYGIRAEQSWKYITLLDEALDITAVLTSFTLDSVDDFHESGGQLIRIGDEIMRYEGKTLTDITVERGANGSTAAIHLNNAEVYLWTYAEDIMNCCWDIVNGIYKRRTGENASSTSVLTSAGVIVTPRDITDYAAAIIATYKELI
jgi:hypothetical protein